MARLFLLLGVFLCFSACREKKVDLVSNDTAAYEISTENWPKQLPIKPEAREILKDWPEFNEFETSFDAMYTVANRDDLTLVIENLIEKQNALASATYPQKFDRPQVKSRQKVFKTYLLKIKGDLIYRVDVKTSVLQMIEAHNAFRNQFNVIINNTLDTNLILEE